MEYLILAFLVAYLLPWIAAVACEHRRHPAILAANLLVGWTGIGWVALLAYALASEPARPPRPAAQLRLVPSAAPRDGCALPSLVPDSPR